MIKMKKQSNLYSKVSEEIPKEAAAEQAPEVTEIEPQPVQEGEQVEAAWKFKDRTWNKD